MKVPFLDLKLIYEDLREEYEKDVLSLMQSGYYIGGDKVSKFEQEYAQYSEADYCVGVANGLDALKIALRTININHGDEIIVPSHTFIATWLAVTECGGIPVPVEVCPDTFNIDIDRIENSITNKTKAILPVHLYGQPANLDAICNLANKYNLYVIEDAAQAHGAKYKGKKIGSHGHIVAWSFYPGKNLGAFGDAGGITTNDKLLADKARVIGNYGSEKKYINDIAGFNSRLDPIQAVVLSTKLKHLDRYNSRRNEVAKAYLENLDIDGVVLPKVIDNVNPVWHLFCVKLNNRDQIQSKLKEYGIETLIHYPIPPHLQNAYKYLNFFNGSLPTAEGISESVLSLPISPIISDEEVQYVIDILKKLIIN